MSGTMLDSGENDEREADLFEDLRILGGNG